MRVGLTFLLGILSLTACEKDELPVQPYNRGNAQHASVDMQSDYSHQIYFKLTSSSVVQWNLKTSWDIAFDCSENNLIYLNSSKSMFVSRTDKKDFDAVSDTLGFGKNKAWDRSSGHTDSTAFGNLSDNLDYVFLIDRGYDAAGDFLGIKKIQITSIDNNTYQFRYANLDGSMSHIATVQKDKAYNRLHFSMNTNAVTNDAPMKDAYDLVFTQYTYTFIKPFQPYLVTGVLINPNGVRVAIDQTKLFEDIQLSDTLNYVFSHSEDGVGYSWKDFNFSTGIYIVDPSINYIIQDTEGFYYKLHFIDFYNTEGKKGCPKFEFQKL